SRALSGKYAAFRSRKRAAPLKPGEASATARGRGRTFRSRKRAAPLKPHHADLRVAHVEAFRSRMRAAPLKRRVCDFGAAIFDFPLSKEGGPIEATASSPMS